MDHFQSDAEYFTRRADQERAAARQAADPRARQSHIDLAERYSNAARALEEAVMAGGAQPAAATSAAQLRPELRILP